jgi:phosphonate transport system substrate-binding protein
MLKFFYLILVLGACSKQAENGAVIKMGFTPAESTEKVSSNGQVLAALLEKKVGKKFKIYVANDYTALVESMRTGQVDVGWLAPFAFVLAEKKAGAKVVLKSVRHGQASQYSAIIALESRGYKTIDDLKGKNIAWTDPSSSSGHIAPKAALIAQGIDPDKFFGKQTWAGSHESAVMAVMNNTVDAAATFADNATGSSGSWTKYGQALGAKARKIKAVFVTPPMPSDTVSYSSQFASADPALAEKVKKALIELSLEPEGLQALKNLYGIEGLVPALSAEYEPLRLAAAKLGYTLDSTKNKTAEKATK